MRVNGDTPDRPGRTAVRQRPVDVRGRRAADRRANTPRKPLHFS